MGRIERRGLGLYLNDARIQDGDVIHVKTAGLHQTKTTLPEILPVTVKLEGCGPVFYSADPDFPWQKLQFPLEANIFEWPSSNGDGV